ncbi:hypothetical protein C2845_PM03G22040 [Panicum miliaceum]|uniref:Uncharacterized protein n=1 Tax=Panicum miliaceum TaxID=4540 RepID=A0A3L6TH66_PANMI|nr:hypothetical protein C2845_PM03G22040 [Panicum miliaceum]
MATLSCWLGLSVAQERAGATPCLAALCPPPVPPPSISLVPSRVSGRAAGAGDGALFLASGGEMNARGELSGQLDPIDEKDEVRAILSFQGVYKNENEKKNQRNREKGMKFLESKEFMCGMLYFERLTNKM